MNAFIESQTKIKIRPYLASPTDASFFANRCSSEDVRVGDVYLKKILGHDADNLGIPVNYFDLTGKLGWYGARCKYAFFVPAVVTKLSMDGFEYKSIEGLLTPDLGVSVSRIGEAIKNLSEDFKMQHPKIVWSKAAGMRNILIHEYFGIDEDILWKTIKVDLPPFKKQISEILEKYS